MKILLKAIVLLTAIFFLSGFEINQRPNAVPDFRIVKRWDLPVILREVSGIAMIDSARFACIQDELGSIFIYNIETATIQEEIPFGPAGDYEDITLVNDTAWVLRSDGTLFEVNTLYSKKTSIKEYTMPLLANQNVEGLCYDKNNNRLLLAVKGGQPAKMYKGVYAFDLATRTMGSEPAFKIDTRQELKPGNKKRGFEIMPSGIAIHPQTNEMYLTDARNSLLLILDSSGSVKRINDLNSKEFRQAEGIAFDKNGDMFISNEAAKGGGNILKVAVTGQ